MGGLLARLGWLLVLHSLILPCPLVAGWEHLTSPESLQRVVNGNQEVLVAFVAPNEPKSASLEPEWLSAVSEGKGGLASIDCAANKAACEDHQVTSYPSILLFKSGQVLSRYQGPRRPTAILQFVARWKLPSVSEITTTEQLDTFKAADDVAFVAFLDPQDTHSSKVFAEAASDFRDQFRFAIVTDKPVAESQDVEIPSVVCYRSVDRALVKSQIEPDKLYAWVTEASRPVIGDLTVWNRHRLLDRGWPMVYLFAPTAKEREGLRESVYKFAKSYYDSLTSVLVDPFEFPELMSQMGLEEGHFPAGAVHQLAKDRVYPYPRDSPLTPNAIQKWGLDVYQGRIKPWTPPGVITTYEDLGPTRVATRTVSLRSFPGMKIKIAGHEEL